MVVSRAHGINGVLVTRLNGCGVVVDGVEVDDSVTGHHVVELRGDVFL